jgi:hypothetical protein
MSVKFMSVEITLSEGVSVFKVCAFLQCVNYLLYVELYNINLKICFLSL